ncbi:MAG: zinc-binding dehydrogenase [Actinomycetia bacterium]|nr:zinc-binding dehydrogenase [Actinomycetes bacterium]MCP5034325.1 zinc-binding dehydrogenase [Actinomycetes bacterium]
MTTAGSNRVAILIGPRRIEITELGRPELIDGSVLVAIDRCGVGGPDVEAWISGEVPAPAWFGHEWVGRIVAIGAGVEGRFEGERVVGATSPPCGTCPPCRAGLGSGCLVALSMIVGTDAAACAHGAFAEIIRVDSRRVHRVPEAIDDDLAALSEPAAVAVHAVNGAHHHLGDLVVVVGAGTIGLLVAALARLAGASRVVAIDPEPTRRELACSLGADAAFAPGRDAVGWLEDHGHGLGADVVYECAGHPAAMSMAMRAARAGGTVVVVGVSNRVDDVRPGELVRNQLTVRAALGYTVADVHRALDLMADDRLRVERITDRVIGFAELAPAFEELASNPAAPRKVLFSPQH